MELSPAFAGPIKQLGAFLRVAETGYAICICNTPADRRRILSSLTPELADEGIGVFELVLDESTPSIPGRIRVALTSDAFKEVTARVGKVAISLTGAEATVTDAERKAEGRPRVLQGLNQQRDWMDQLGHPIVFWVSEWLRGLLPRVAPDFWAGRSVVIEFPTADESRAHAFQEMSTGWWTFGSVDEAKRKIRIYEELLRDETEPRERAGFLLNRAILHHTLGELAQARKLYEQSLALKQELGDKAGIAAALHQLATLAQDQGDYTEARELDNKALDTFKGLGAKSEQSAVLHQLATVAQRQGDYVEARKLYDQSLALKQELGDKASTTQTLHQLGVLAHDQGDYVEARKLYDQSLAIEHEIGNKAGIALTLHQLGVLAHDQGDYVEARKLYDQSLALKQELGDKAGIASTLHQLGVLAHDQGDSIEARKLYDQSLAIVRELGNKANIAASLHQLANLAYDKDDLPAARKLYEQSLAIARELGDKSSIATTLGQMGRLAQAERDDWSALTNYLQALAIFEELKSPYRDLAKQDIARMQQRLGDEAFKKLYDEVVAELNKEQPDSQKKPTADS